MTKLYSEDGETTIESYPAHVERRLKQGWSLTDPKASKPKKEKTSADDKK